MMGSALTMASTHNNLRAALSPEVCNRIYQEDMVLVNSDRDD